METGEYVVIDSQRFNRYIVECKVPFTDNSIVSLPADLIDTLWNVKEDETVRAKMDARDLIDTLWNVKMWCNAPFFSTSTI